MPVVPVLRHVLRGVIRAQVTYSITIVNRLIRAQVKNPELGLFFSGSGPGSITDMQLIVTKWQTQLAARS